MCVAYKELTAEEYSKVQKLLQNAKLALQDREKKLAEVYEKIERDFILLGATAVEDRLVHFLVSFMFSNCTKVVGDFFVTFFFD